MESMIRTFKRPLTSARFDIALVQACCFIGGPALLVIAVLKMATLKMTEEQLLLGALSAVACTLLMTILGLVAPLTMRPRRRK